jgi:hypothetical protein
VHEKPTSFPESGWSGVSSASSGSSAAASSSFKGIANPSLSKDSAYLMKVQRYDSTSGIIKPSFSGSKGLPSVGYVPASTAFTSSSTASETPISISSGFDAMKDHKFLTKSILWLFFVLFASQKVQFNHSCHQRCGQV